MEDTPPIERIEYDAGTSPGSTPSIAVVLSAEPGVAVTAALFEQMPQGRDWIAVGTAATSRNLVITGVTGLDATKGYVVAVTGRPDDPEPPWGVPVTLVWQAVTPTQVAVDGSSVIVAWTMPQPTNFATVRVILSDVAANVVLASPTVSGVGARLEPPAPLDPSRTYEVAIRGLLGAAVGPRAVAASRLPLTPPKLVDAAYSQAGGVYSIAVSGTTATDLTTVAALLRDGVAVAEVTADANGKATFALGSALDPGSRWEIALLHRSGSVSGPPGPPAPIPLQTPVLTAARCQRVLANDHLAFSWSLPPADPQPTGAAVVVRDADGQDVAQLAVAQGLQGSVTVAPLVAGHRYPIAIAPVIGSVRGLFHAAHGAAFLLLQNTPYATVAGDEIVAEWPLPGPQAPGAYRLRLVERLESGATRTLAQVDTHVNTARLSLPAMVAGTDPALVVDALVAPAWTAGAGVAPLPVAAPEVVILGGGIDPVTGGLPLSWSTVRNAEVYEARVSAGALSEVTYIPIDGTSWTIPPDELPAPGVYALRIRARTGPFFALSFGPWSSPVTVLTLAPTGVRVRYDGRVAAVSWEAVPAPGVVGYAVAVVLDGDVMARAPTTATAVDVPIAMTPSDGWTVVVQAVTADGAGSPSTPVPLFEPGLYLSTEPDVTPHVVPLTSGDMEPRAVVLGLPDIFKGTVSPRTLPGPPFQMKAVSGSTFAYVLKLGVTDPVLWDFAGVDTVAGLREPLRTAYDAFLAKLADLGVTPSGWRVVKDAIARAMPLTFAETLFYTHGFDPAGGWVDLQPGMVLRAEYEAYQYLGADAAHSALLNGFAGGASADYEIGSYTDPLGPYPQEWLTGFDSFLAVLTAFDGTAVPGPRTSAAGASGAGGVLDLYASGLAQPFCRLVYPPTVLDAEHADPRAGLNPALLFAPDYVTLEAETAHLRAAQPLGGGATATYLRGRTALRACIRVWVDGAPWVVPVGTTVGNVLASMALRPPVFYRSPGVHLRLEGLTLTRAPGCAIDGGSSAYRTAAVRPVKLDWYEATAYGRGTDWLSLPLLGGDRLTTGGAAT
jgi:hypothetical protein